MTIFDTLIMPHMRPRTHLPSNRASFQNHFRLGQVHTAREAPAELQFPMRKFSKTDIYASAMVTVHIHSPNP